MTVHRELHFNRLSYNTSINQSNKSLSRCCKWKRDNKSAKHKNKSTQNTLKTQVRIHMQTEDDDEGNMS